MNVGSLEQVVVDLVEVGDGLDDVDADVALIAKTAEAAPDADVLLLAEGVVGGVVLAVGVEPLLDLDDAGAVVEAVGDVGGLGADLADHADEGDLGDVGAVDPEAVLPVEGLLGVDDLLYRYRPQRIFAHRVRRLAPALRAPEEPPVVAAGRAVSAVAYMAKLIFMICTYIRIYINICICICYMGLYRDLMADTY